MKTKKKFRRIATIDIGSNAIKFKQFRVRSKKSLYPLELDTFKRIDLRLGEDVFKNNKISEASEKRLIKELKSLSKKVRNREVEWAGICATSATRNASNGIEICKKIETVCGSPVKILSGREEAYYLKDANIKKIEDLDYPMYVDVGGGSTEIYLKIGETEAFESFDIGAVRIMNNKDNREEWNKLEEFLKKLEANPTSLIGIGGNIRRIFKILQLDKNSLLDINKFEDIKNKLSGMTNSERIKLFDLAEDRADVIVPACEIFSFILQRTKISKIYAIDWGICDAIAYRYFKENLA